MHNLTIVMYHFVRDLKHSRYPEIKGLNSELFDEQIQYLKKHYNPVTAYELMDAVESGEALPPKSCLLTFDDAYIDHFTEVFPVLDRQGMSGCFFPPAKSIMENQVLDVNKIHFILASVDAKQSLVDFINDAVDEHRAEYGLESNEHYWQECGVANRYDPAEVIFVKRMLQRDLPEKLRTILTDGLFKKFVSDSETAFAKELYMNPEQIRHMQRNGMYIGSHGFDHYWLNSLSEDGQRREIDLSLEFLESVGSDPSRWIMCYPYGGYNDTTLKILGERNCLAGLTTEVGIADLARDNPLTLPRLDTNDLPKAANAAPNEWTLKAK